MPALVTCTGYGNTGSSAGTNILEEFRCIKSCGNAEFTFAHEPDGIADLENSLREGHRLKTDLAIKRFLKLMHNLSCEGHYKQYFNGKFECLAIEFIESIVKCKWNGWWHRAFETAILSDKDEFKIKLAKKTYDFLLKSTNYDMYEPDGWRPHYQPLTDFYYSNFIDEYDEQYFLKQVTIFTDALLQEINGNNCYKYIMLDQAIPPISVLLYARYFFNSKTIIIDRDPRDLYIINKAKWGSGYIPAETVELFIRWYSRTRKLRNTELKNDRVVLFLPFEALIYEYDTSLNRLMDFLNLSAADHVNKLKYFNPDISRKNTQVFLQYPALYEDVKKIEKELEEYCYPYPINQEKISQKDFLIQSVNDIAFNIQQSGVLPDDIKKYNKKIIFSMTSLSQKIQILKRLEGIRYFKFLVKLFLMTPSLLRDVITTILLFHLCKTTKIVTKKG
jgi:hypothetical protein